MPTPKETEIEEETAEAPTQTIEQAPEAEVVEVVAGAAAEPAGLSSAPEAAPTTDATADDQPEGAAVATDEPAGLSSAPETAPTTDTPADDQPGGSAEATAEPATPPAAEAEEPSAEDISLEAILEDLKRREGRSE